MAKERSGDSQEVFYSDLSGQRFSDFIFGHKII
jgi:hypothetical protein